MALSSPFSESSIQEGCHWDAETCAGAAASGSLEALKWARDGGRQWDRRTCAAAAANGHLELMRWARRQGAQLEPQGDHRGGGGRSPGGAAVPGGPRLPLPRGRPPHRRAQRRLAVLRWATAADCCPCGAEVVPAAAAVAGQWAVQSWLVEESRLADYTATLQAATPRSNRLLAWALKRS
eukprot:jgi/Tetstr1/464750/TSEL_009497.t1